MRTIEGDTREHATGGIGSAAPAGGDRAGVAAPGGGHLDIERVLRRQRQRSLAQADGSGEPWQERSAVSRALVTQCHTPVPAPGTYAGDPELVVASEPYGASAEMFRELRVQLHAKALERPAKVALAIVSPERCEGKSHIAANLAASFAALGGRTLLVDADLRSPRLHRLFDVDGEVGLSTILRGDGGPSLVRQLDGLPGLYFLPAGAVPPHPVELLQSPRLSLLLLELLLAFDHVVLDTPADACGPDARLLAGVAGAALVVGRKDCSRMDSLRALLGRLAQQRVEVAGMVMNQYRA